MITLRCIRSKDGKRRTSRNVHTQSFDESKIETYSTIDKINPWNCLGVAKSSSREQIREAYHKKVKEIFPERDNWNAEDLALYNKLNKSYKVIMNPGMRAMYATGLREVEELILDDERENNDQDKYDDLIETMIEDLLPSGPLIPFHLASKQYPNPFTYLNSFLYSSINDYQGDNNQDGNNYQINDEDEEDTKFYEHIDKYPIPEMINRYDEEREWVGAESYQNVMYNGEGFTLQILAPSLLYPIGIIGSDYLRSFAPDSSFFISDCFCSIIYSSFLSTVPQFSPNSPLITVSNLKNKEEHKKQEQDRIEITKKRGWFKRKYYRLEIRNTEYEKEGAIEFYYFPLFPFISHFKLFDSHGMLIARAHYTNSLLSSSITFFFPQREQCDTDQNTATPNGKEPQEEWIEGGSIRRVDARLVSREYHYSPGSDSTPSLPPFLSLFSLLVAYKLDQQPPSITRYCKYLYKKFMASDCRS